MKKFGKIKVLLIILSLFSVFFLTQSVFHVSAQTGDTKSSVVVKPLEMVLKDVQADNNHLQGTLLITNPNSISYEKISYTGRLLSPDVIETRLINGELVTIISQGDLISFINSPLFSLASHQTVQFPISLLYSPAIISKSYKLQIAVSDSNNKLLGAEKETVSIHGNDSFLSIQNCVIVTEGVEYSPNIGPNVEPKGEVYGKCSVTNPTNKTITAKPVSTYAINQVVGYPDSEKNTVVSDVETIIGPRVTRKVTFPLPPLDKPQVYEALSYLTTTENVQVSSQVAFRWVIAGASSSIRSITLDNTDYQKGQVAHVVVAADPSMDLFWESPGSKTVMFPPASPSSLFRPKLQGTPLKDPKIGVIITDDKGNTCGEKEQTVSISKNQRFWSDQLISVPIARNCPSAKATVTVKDGNQELAKKSMAEDNTLTPKNQTQQNETSTYGIFIVLFLTLCISIIVGIWYWKKKKTPVSPIAEFIFILGFLFSSCLIFGAAHTYAAPLELPPGQQEASMKYLGISVYNSTYCSAADFIGWRKVDRGGGRCDQNIDFSDQVYFTLLDTQDQIVFNGNTIHARVAGRIHGVGCANTHAGLIIRAYVDGTNQGVKINGGSSKLIIGDIVTFAGGTGAKDVDQDLSITADTTLACGIHTVKLEIVPFEGHVGMAASDPAEDIPLSFNGTTSSFSNRTNCDGTQACWGVLQKQIKKQCECGNPCSTPADCQGAQNFCTVCTLGTNGASTCQPPPPPACGAHCQRDDQCSGAKDGCTWCATTGSNAGTCVPPIACGTVCTKPTDCENARDGCIACVPNDTGSTSSCKPPPACGVACTKDDQCAGAKDGCTFCSAGKCSAFSENMCGCDGMDFTRADGTSQSFFPGDNVTFIAYGVVPSKGWKDAATAAVNAATVASMTFTLYEAKIGDLEHTTKLAESAAITPVVSESSPNKVRYKVTWNQKIPTTVPAGVEYKVQAKLKCSAKPGVLGLQTTILENDNYFTRLFDSISALFAKGSVLSATDQQAGNQQHAATFSTTAKIIEKSCTIIRFSFE